MFGMALTQLEALTPPHKKDQRRLPPNRCGARLEDRPTSDVEPDDCIDVVHHRLHDVDDAVRYGRHCYASHGVVPTW